MRVGKLLGIEIVLHPLLPLIFAAAWFAHWLERLALMFLLVFAHELCHALMARLLHVRVLEVELHPFGGVAKMKSVFAVEPMAELLIAAAGPACNLLLAMAATFALYFYPQARVQAFLEGNLMLALFNLLPALPLDGGRMLRATLSRTMRAERATRIMAVSGMIFGALFALLGCYAALFKGGNPTFPCVGLLLLLTARREMRLSPMYLIEQIEDAQRRISDEKGMTVRILAVSSGMTLGEVMRLFIPGKYHLVRIVDADGRTTREADQTAIFRAAARLGQNAPVSRA